MRLRRVLLVLGLAMSSKVAAQDPTCTTKPMTAEVRFDTTHVRELAGQYDLFLVLTTGREWGASDHRGRLELWVRDSLQSRRGMFGPLPHGLERPVGGRFLVASPDSDNTWWRSMASANPDRPGVLLQGTSLRMGDQDVLDGTGEVLTITHIAPGGFRGRWQQDNGIAMMIDSVTHQRVPDPAGYFCARRLALGR